MASVQERLQLKRTAVDKWTIREQLCLASAVSCSGDQNWMSVSRSLKMLCGNNRPPDWFSQKSCAVQYGELLENVETPKRKKRSTSEKDNSTIAETPTEYILRKLTQERISELRALIQKEQEEFVKLREELLMVQNGLATDAQLREMYAEIEQEKEQEFIKQQKYLQWLKEREERKNELQKAWRPGTGQQIAVAGPSTSTAGQQQKHAGTSSQLSLSIKSEDVETEDSNSKPGTSPLLTSLLKSPSPAPNSTAAPIPSVSSARVTAPTITNLLTGNNSHIQQMAIASTSTQQYNAVHNQPLTGPVPSNPTPQEPVTTPSKSAPTLSMLLENKNKDNSAVTSTTGIEASGNERGDIKDQPNESQEAMEIDEDGTSSNKDEEQQLMEVFNGLIPDNIDELADILTNNNAILNPELLEEESILENVESLMDVDQEETDYKEKTENEENKKVDKNEVILDEKNTMQNSLNLIKIKEEVKNENNDESSVAIKHETKNEYNHSEDNVEIIKKDLKTETEVTVRKEEDIEEEKSHVIEQDANVNELNIQDKIKDERKESEVKNTKIQSLEVSDDSSDNTTLQVLKEKFATTTEQTNKEVTEVSDSSEKQSTENKKEDVSEDDDIIIEISAESLRKENVDDSENMESTITPSIVEEKSNESIHTVEEEDSRSEIATETNDTCEEQKKSPSESVIIVIQEDDDSDTGKVSEKENLETLEQNNFENQQKNDIHMNESEKQQSVNLKEEKKIPDITIEQVITEDVSKTPKSDDMVEENNTTEQVTATIVIDTDEESPVEIVKDDITTRTKRDYSRKKVDTSIIINQIADKKSETEPVVEENRQNLSIKRLKERDGSESPYIDDETTTGGSDIMPRTRRRYSSTPVFDSIPNSPASSDDKEYKAWKKSILMIYNRLTIHKNASIFLRPVTEDLAPNYKQIVHRPMDLQTIKKNIENGIIRTTAEFQRDVMLMCQNAIMYNQTNNNVYNMAKEMWADSVNVIETLLESVKKDADRLSSSGSSSKSRGRKSNRLP